MTMIHPNNTPAIVTKIIAVIARIPGPVRLLSALEQRNRFRNLDADALRDMGLTQEHADRARLSDFLGNPRR